jgi:hypothetical protein
VQVDAEVMKEYAGYVGSSEEILAKLYPLFPHSIVLIGQHFLQPVLTDMFFPPRCFVINLSQFSHPESVGSVFLRNVEQTFTV